MNKNTFKCPECNSNVTAWADIDAMVTFEVSKNGKLIRKSIENWYQTDGRAGIECTNCSWELTGGDLVEYPHFESLADEALEYQHNIRSFAIKSLK